MTRKNKVRLICLVVVIAAIFGSLAIIRLCAEEKTLCSTFITKNGQELIAESELIITGRVKKQMSVRVNAVRGEQHFPDIDYLIEIDEILSGKKDGETLIVRTLDGYDLKTNTEYNAYGYSEFSRGEKVVLFLIRDGGYDATDEDYYVTLGGQQGKYILHKDGKMEMLFGTAQFSSLDELKQEIKHKKGAD